MAEPAGTIRRAEPCEARALTALARRSKAHWPYDAALLFRMQAAIDVTPELIQGAVVLVHETGGIPDGVAAIAQDGEAWELEHFWVEPSRVGRGVGRRLLEAILDEARALGVARLVIQSDPHAAGFYERMGAKRVGHRESEAVPGRMLPLLRLEV